MTFNRIRIVAIARMGALVARANHSFAVEFLEDQTDAIEGTVTEVWFKNPHVRYYIDARTEDGEIVNWDVRGASPTSLIRRGWTPKTIEEGDRITVHGHLGRDGRKLLSIIWIELADGTKLTEDY